MKIMEDCVDFTNEEENLPVHKIHRDRRKTLPAEENIRSYCFISKVFSQERFLGFSHAGTMTRMCTWLPE